MQITRKKKTVIIAAVVVGLLTIIILSKALQKKEGEPVQIGRVERKAHLESKVTASGEVRPVKFYNLTAEVPGRVEQIYVVEGQTVKKGQPLVKVDPTQSSFAVSAGEASVRVTQADVANQQVAVDQAKNNVNQTKAILAAAESDLERLKADYQFAGNEFKRNEELVEKGIITKSQFDQYKSRLDQARALVNAQQSRINQIKVQIKDAELAVTRAEAALNSSQQRVQQGQAQLAQQADQLKKTTRFSPIDGVVSSLPVKVGEYALASFSTTPLLTVADMSQINAEIKVDETDIADVQVGQKARVKVDALGDIEIDGDVIEKGASAITRSGQTITSTANSQEAKDFLVKIKLNPTPEIAAKLRPGMSTTSVITTATVDSVLTVPLQAIIPREPPKDQNQPAEQPAAGGPQKKKEVEGVFVFDNGRARFKEVTTGIKGDQEIELKSGVKENELKEGEEIIIGPYKTLRTLKDGDQVKREEKPATPETKS
ncbi:MAG TPA: efflux RND transporter periplasmic adaptor subunit [Blastocatellia bacterium]|nr:efflux RND transporter periplasmic adaptor subunit [Blastocatellia bacterium]